MEGTLDPDIVEGRQLEGLNPDDVDGRDVVDGRIGRDDRPDVVD